MIDADELYRMLLSEYGMPPWWSYDPFAVMVQAVLVQNTAWSNVVKTTEGMGGIPSPDEVLSLEQDELEAMIRPCGFFHAKARAIKALALWWKQYGCDPGDTASIPAEKLREDLLSISGVGEETADVILLYALYRPVFVVDAYTRRMLSRLGYRYSSDNDIREYFTQGLPEDALIYGRFHWLILQHCISLCRKKPLCSKCFLEACRTHE